MSNFIDTLWFIIHIPGFMWGLWRLRNMARYRHYMKFTAVTPWQRFEKRLLDFLIAEDEAVNALIGSGSVPAAGNPHFTVSQRLAEMRSAGSKVGIEGCKILTWAQNNLFNVPGDHCTICMNGFPPDLPTEG